MGIATPPMTGGLGGAPFCTRAHGRPLQPPLRNQHPRRVRTDPFDIYNWALRAALSLHRSSRFRGLLCARRKSRIINSSFSAHLFGSLYNAPGLVTRTTQAYTLPPCHRPLSGIGATMTIPPGSQSPKYEASVSIHRIHSPRNRFFQVTSAQPLGGLRCGGRSREPTWRREFDKRVVSSPPPEPRHYATAGHRGEEN